VNLSCSFPSAERGYFRMAHHPLSTDLTSVFVACASLLPVTGDSLLLCIAGFLFHGSDVIARLSLTVPFTHWCQLW
jgi:hypothetical protein